MTSAAASRVGRYRGPMPYPKKLLNDFEEVAIDLHPHWWHFAKPAMVLAGSIALGIFALVGTDGGTVPRTGLGWFSLIAIVGSALWLVTAYAQWATTNFVVTSDRVIFRSGVIAKSGIEIPLERVNTVHFDQGMFERMIGVGSLVIESGGEEGQQNFTDIREPDRVQKEIHVQMDHNERRRASFSGDGSGGQVDVATQLEKFEGMLERGTLTQEEFDAQKAKLLGG